MLPTDRELRAQGAHHARGYEMVEAQFNHFFLARVIADELSRRLPLILSSTAPTMAESSNDGVHVLHVASLKLRLVRDPRGDKISVQLFGGRDGDGIFVEFTHDIWAGLQVEYISLIGRGDPRSFSMRIPNSCTHPLNVQLGKLLPLMIQIFEGDISDPVNLMRISE